MTKKMRATQGVSIPRSGHSAVYHLARLYFGDAFIYCDTRNPKYCGCGCVPCINPRRTYAKNHDFGLRRNRALQKVPVLRKYRSFLECHWPFEAKGTPVLDDERYFIQYRSPVRCITSNFKLYVQRNPHKNTRSDWEMFAVLDLIYWKRFIDKWVLNFPFTANKPLFCSYEALLKDPETRIREILRYFSDGPLDEARVASVLLKNPIAVRNSISEFEFYDPVFFKKLEDDVAGRMEKLDLPLFAEGY